MKLIESSVESEPMVVDDNQLQCVPVAALPIPGQLLCGWQLS